MSRTVVYIIMFLTALTIYVMQRLRVPLPDLVNNYVNDLLYVPLVLGVIEFVIRKFKKDSLFKLPIAFVVFLASFYSFYFEYYLPGINTRYTADWIDVVLYFLGGFAFFYSEKIDIKIVSK